MNYHYLLCVDRKYPAGLEVLIKEISANVSLGAIDDSHLLF